MKYCFNLSDSYCTCRLADGTCNYFGDCAIQTLEGAISAYQQAVDIIVEADTLPEGTMVVVK